MLTELKLTNFRLFDNEITVRFKPITIFIGRNSSGKSSVVKFLLMLQQSLNPNLSQFLSPEGDKVRLGVFSSLKNTLTAKRSLHFDLTAKSPIPATGPHAVDQLDLFEEIAPADRLYKANATVSYSKKANIGRVVYSLLDKSTGKSAIKLDTRILDDSEFLDIVAASDIESKVRTISDISPSELTDQPAGTNYLKAITDFYEALELINTLRTQINSISHLSPVRDESQRVILISHPPRGYVGQRGQYALPHLQQMVTEEKENYEFIRPHLERVASIESVEFKTTEGYLSRAFAKSKTTGGNVLLADYGFGVSQCLPIFVQGAIMAPHTSLMVEQPEAQLHPTAQLELGSFFANLWTERQVGSIVETHSSNILLRLRRLIARGELSHTDVSVAFFANDEDNKNMPVIKNLEINEDGSMERGLPMEFFGADVIEGLNLGART